MYLFNLQKKSRNFKIYINYNNNINIIKFFFYRYILLFSIQLDSLYEGDFFFIFAQCSTIYSQIIKNEIYYFFFFVTKTYKNKTPCMLNYILIEQQNVCFIYFFPKIVVPIEFLDLSVFLIINTYFLGTTSSLTAYRQSSVNQYIHKLF